MEHRILAIDYGLSRVGLALSYGTLAEPLEILANNERLLPEILQRTQSLGVTMIVVGMSENTMAEKTSAFVKELQLLTELSIQFQDETLTSAEVTRLLKERSRGKKQYRGPIDHYAAALILQRFLDESPTIRNIL